MSINDNEMSCLMNCPIDSMFGSLVCTICHSLVTKPVQINCGHIFCWQCLYDHLTYIIHSSRGSSESIDSTERDDMADQHIDIQQVEQFENAPIHAQLASPGFQDGGIAIPLIAQSIQIPRLAVTPELEQRTGLAPTGLAVAQPGNDMIQLDVSSEDKQIQENKRCPTCNMLIQIDSSNALSSVSKHGFRVNHSLNSIVEDLRRLTELWPQRAINELNKSMSLLQSRNQELKNEVSEKTEQISDLQNQLEKKSSQSKKTINKLKGMVIPLTIDLVMLFSPRKIFMKNVSKMDYIKQKQFSDFRNQLEVKLSAIKEQSVGLKSFDYSSKPMVSFGWEELDDCVLDWKKGRLHFSYTDQNQNMEEVYIKPVLTDKVYCGPFKQWLTFVIKPKQLMTRKVPKLHLIRELYQGMTIFN